MESDVTAYIEKSIFLDKIIDGKTRSVIEHDGEAYIPDNGNAFIDQLEEQMGWAREEICEDDPYRLELATFCLVWRSLDDSEEVELFVGRRIPEGEAHEDRLHDLYTIGWGGGPEPQDKHGASTPLSNAAFRELNEEVETSSLVTPMYYTGLVYSEADSVSRDHLGMVWHIGTRTAQAKETDKMEGQWVALSDLRQDFEGEELVSWSRVLREHIEEILESP